MSDTSKTVDLNLRVQSTGADKIGDLAQDLRGVGAAAKGTAVAADQLATELEAAAAATARQRDAERSAVQAQNDARRARNEAADALARYRAEADKATRSTSDWQAGETRLRVATVEARIALRDKTAAAQQATAQARQAAAAEADVAQRLQAAASAYRATGAAATTAGRQQAAATASAREQLSSLATQLRSFQTLAAGALGGSILGGVAADVARTADAYSNLAARVRLAVGASGDFDAAMAGVQAIAQRTGSSLEATADLFSKVSANARALGLDTSGALNLTESINQAIQLSGSSAESAAGSVLQFSQALASGTLRGDELNSVLEGSPRLARAIADGLGVTTGALREMGAAGQLSAQQVVGALQSQSAVLSGEFAQLPATVGRAISGLSNAWTLYVGEVDKANGISAAAARAITLLADNLDTLGALLFSAGKAAAAWQALKLAQSFLDIQRATIASTAAVVANTAALSANAAAGTAAAAGAGRFAALLSTLKVGGLLAIVTNLREIGTWLGESVARWQGYGAAIEEAETKQRADAEATRLAAAEKARLAAQARLAAEAALGLTDASRRLVAQFDEATTKGASTADALGKVAKAMSLDDLSGIAAAGAALDALAVQGKATADQVAEAWGAALRGVDLGAFATQAGAAFDDSEQGARRLKATLDALGEESLRRVGTSTRELQTGFNAAMTSALNDTDALSERLEALGVTGERASALLAQSLGNALKTASTEAAVQAVIDRLQALGEAGRISGDALAAGLDKAKAKLDDMRDGVGSLDEALRAFGMKTQAQMQATADKLGEAYQRIANDSTVSLAQQRAAFEQWARAAIEANGGIETEAVKVARAILEIRIAAEDAGDGINAQAWRMRSDLQGVESAARAAASALSGIGTGVADRVSTTGNTREERLAGQNAVDNSWLFNLRSRRDRGQLTEQDLAIAQVALGAERGNLYSMEASFAKGNVSLHAVRQQEGSVRLISQVIADLSEKYGNNRSTDAGTTGDSTSNASSNTRTVKIDIGGRSTEINVASQADSNALVSLLRQLESARGVSA